MSDSVISGQRTRAAVQKKATSVRRAKKSKVTSAAVPEGDATEFHETKAPVPLGVALIGPALANVVASASPEPEPKAVK